MKVVAQLTRLSSLALTLSLALTGCDDGSRNHLRIDAGQVDVVTPAAHVRVTVPAAGTFRVRLSHRADFPEIPSYAVEPAVLVPGAAFTVDSSDPAAVVVRTAGAALRITWDPLKLALLDGDGNVVAQEATPIAWAGQGALISWELPDGEHVYGLGDKAGGFDRRGHQYQMWNLDHYGWTVTGPESDPLYKSIPSLVFLKNGQAHGLFVDNPGRAQVDVGATDVGRLTYHAERASTMDLYLIAGPDPKNVISAYTALTGRAPLPPRWSLGYHQSRYSYMSEEDVRGVASRLRADSIPADAIWLDIDYQENYAPFTVNTTTFPNFTGMISDFATTGLNIVLITDLHIRKKDSDWQYQSGLAGDHFIHTTTGDLLIASVWPGYASQPAKSVFPEFTLADTRTWWGSLYQEFVSNGAAGFWNDMNEPTIFTWLDTPGDYTKTIHDDIPHRLDDGTTVDHVTIHNAYGLLNARATFEGELTLRPNARPFVLTRAAYAGSQHWGATWTGDNTANREHLAVTIPQLINLGVSGYAFAGADVGGFSGCPYSDTNADLFMEWMELGALQPFFRNHSVVGSCQREPWVLGADVEARLRKAIERRYKLLPYLYTVFEESSRTGLPVMRPLWLEYPSDASTATNDTTYLLGRDLLVAPKLVEGAQPYLVTLPAAGWWDTTTGLLINNGGEVTITPPANDSIRIFARAGAIVPSQPLTQAAGDVPQGALTLDVWPGSACSGSLYLDDGRTFDYQQGAMARVTYACQPAASGMTVTSASTGSFDNWWSSTQLVIHGAQQPSAVTGANNATLPWNFDASSNTLVVTIDGDGSNWAVNVLW